ncbi:energy-coupling factor transporter transmembrane component T family protein [Candidatus Contubernalis alkaliaceticus]|uniref:energy-coupling factor transporter transmembrane component T family protein n=1 Tax=Candidatus Contubernalis alkaliaceticus TaxID=338645 RepID=UPI001F4C064C|nr:energy-coupling factor transporter transmembrane component T [Candidatus Contubernalis alkalaceticus]UNC93114.1 hypothetical protein HUE98_14070 [Candidatus Contubernalis alkalaceticus]
MGRYHFKGNHIAGVNTWGRAWDTRAKTAAALLFVFGVVSLNTPVLVLAALFFALISALLMGLSFSFLMKKLLLLVPFLALMSVPIILGGGLPPAMDRYYFAALLSLKALASMTAMIVMLVTQPIEEFLEGLYHLKVPYIIITVLFLAYRYTFLFMQEIKSIQRALASRLFSGGIHINALKVYGELSGGLFIKSVDRSEHVYRAMSSRCFQGKMPVSSPSPITSMDMIKTIVTVFVVVFLIVIEQVV